MKINNTLHFCQRFKGGDIMGDYAAEGSLSPATLFLVLILLLTGTLG